MRVIGTTMGLVLCFKDQEDIEQVIQHLTGQLEWVKQNDIKPPYLYAMFDDAIDSNKIAELLEELKSKEYPFGSFRRG